MTIKNYKQLIYCNNESARNFPASLKDTELISGTAFRDCFPIIQLGIQAPPGTKFYLNNSSNYVIIGQTGLFDLDLASTSNISALRFDKKSIDAIKSNDSNILIIDILYFGEGGD